METLNASYRKRGLTIGRSKKRVKAFVGASAVWGPFDYEPTAESP